MGGQGAKRSGRLPPGARDEGASSEGSPNQWDDQPLSVLEAQLRDKGFWNRERTVYELLSRASVPATEVLVSVATAEGAVASIVLSSLQDALTKPLPVAARQTLFRALPHLILKVKREERGTVLLAMNDVPFNHQLPVLTTLLTDLRRDPNFHSRHSPQYISKQLLALAHPVITGLNRPHYRTRLAVALLRAGVTLSPNDDLMRAVRVGVIESHGIRPNSEAGRFFEDVVQKMGAHYAARRAKELPPRRLMATRIRKVQI